MENVDIGDFRRYNDVLIHFIARCSGPRVGRIENVRGWMNVRSVDPYDTQLGFMV